MLPLKKSPIFAEEERDNEEVGYAASNLENGMYCVPNGVHYHMTMSNE